MSDLYREFEGFCRSKGLRPLHHESYRRGEILIAETDLEMDKPAEYPWGYYQTAFFIAGKVSQGKLDGGSWLEFDAFHDSEMNLTADQKRQARINSALFEARSLLDLNHKTGRYH